MSKTTRGGGKRGKGAGTRGRLSAARPRKPGRPFAKGDDPRRNLKGRKATAKSSPNQVMMGALMAKKWVTVGGKTRSMPKLEIILEQQIGPAMQGDRQAVRTLGAMMRAVVAISVVETPAPKDAATPNVHNTRALNKLLDDYVQKYAEAKRLAGEDKSSAREEDDEAE